MAANPAGASFPKGNIPRRFLGPGNPSTKARIRIAAMPKAHIQATARAGLELQGRPALAARHAASTKKLSGTANNNKHVIRV